MTPAAEIHPADLQGQEVDEHVTLAILLAFTQLLAQLLALPCCQELA